MSGAANRTPSNGGAMLALADMFVCASSVIIILLLLQRNVTEAVNTRPMADIVLRCAESVGARIVYQAPSLTTASAVEERPQNSEPLNREALTAFLAAADGDFDRLALRVRLEHAPGRDAECLSMVRDVSTSHNSIFDQSADLGEEERVKMFILFDPVRIAPPVQTAPLGPPEAGPGE